MPAQIAKKISQKFPTSLNILGKTVSVVRADMRNGDFGEYEQHKYTIKISKKSGHEEAMSTLFHEAIHAALHISGLSQVIPASDHSDLEEAIVVCIENAFSHGIDFDKLGEK